MTFNFTAQGGQQTGFGIAGIQGFSTTGTSNPMWSTQGGAGIVDVSAGGTFGSGGGNYNIMVVSNTSGGSQNLALPGSTTVPGGTVYTVVNTAASNDVVQVQDSGGNNIGAPIAQGGSDASTALSFLNTESTMGGSDNRWVPFTRQF